MDPEPEPELESTHELDYEEATPNSEEYEDRIREGITGIMEKID